MGDKNSIGKAPAWFQCINQRHVLVLLMAAVFLLLFGLNIMTPLTADDYGYSQVSSVGDAFRQEYQQYMGWGGRSVVHFLLRLTFLLPKVGFAVLNSLVYVGVSYLLLRIACGKSQNRVAVYLFILSAMWLFLPEFGSTVLWQTGACNYLWGSGIVLAFVSIYHGSLEEPREFKRPALVSAGVFLLGVAAGWCNENTSGGAILLVLCYLVYTRLAGLPWKAWMWTGFAGILLGFFIMITAPGNRVRSNLLEKPDTSPLEQWIERYKLIVTFVWENWLVLIILFALFAFIGWFGSKIPKRTLPSWFWFMASGATAFALALAPVIANRAFFGAAIYLIAACAMALAALPQDSVCKGMALTAAVVPFLLSVIALPQTLGETAIAYSRAREQTRFILLQKQQGNGNVLVPRLPEISDNHVEVKWTGNISTDRGYWVNIDCADYYGIDNITAVERPLWKAVYENGDPLLMNCQSLPEYMDLLQQGRYAFVITLHADDSAPYDGFLDTFGLDPNLTPGISSDYIATWDGEVLYQQTEARGVTYAGSVGGLDIYSSCNSDQSSVQAGGLETSASNGGISLVVVDKTQARAVDSITLIPQGETLLVLR